MPWTEPEPPGLKIVGAVCRPRRLIAEASGKGAGKRSEPPGGDLQDGGKNM